LCRVSFSLPTHKRCLFFGVFSFGWAKEKKGDFDAVALTCNVLGLSLTI